MADVPGRSLNELSVVNELEMLQLNGDSFCAISCDSLLWLAYGVFSLNLHNNNNN